MDIVWDGVTQRATLHEEEADIRETLADAAKGAAWSRVFEVLSQRPELINSTRLGGSAQYAPLHQAAWHGATDAVAERLVALGAWRTHQNADGERPVDVAERRGHRHLLATLAPAYQHHVPSGVLLKVQAHFHRVVRGRADELIKENRLRMPDLEPLLELEKPAMWFAVPGMYGGFSYRLETSGVRPKLISESWCRVVGGSGQRHEITSRGSRLVDEGFV